MSKILHVTPAEVLAARLAIELSEEAGEVPDEALLAIATASPTPAAEDISIMGNWETWHCPAGMCTWTQALPYRATLQQALAIAEHLATHAEKESR